MTALPAASYFSNAARTNAEAKQAQDDILAAMKESPGGAAESELTISGGSVTPTGFAHSVDTESDAATDDLANIVTTNHPDGRLLLLRAEDAARVPTVKHQAGGAGQVTTADGADFVLDSVKKFILLKRNGADWEEVFRGFGGDAAAFRAFVGLVIGTNVLAPNGDGSSLTGISYDMAFLAGFDSEMAAQDVAVQTYAKLDVGRAGSFTGEVASITTAPTGAALILDIEKNGTSIYTVKPQFAAGATTLTGGTLKTDGTEDFVAGDTITFKITQVGSTEPGEGVTFTALAEQS